VIDQAVRLALVLANRGGERRKGVVVHAEEARGAIRRGIQFIEVRVERWIRHRVQPERRFAHLAHALAPCRRVLGAIVRVEAEGHLELVDRLRGRWRMKKAWSRLKAQ
jgi:hypothetical protein